MIRTIEIREATPADVPAIATLSNQLGYRIDERATAGNLEYISKTKDGIVYVAVDDKMIMAWLHVSKRVSLESGIFYEILGLVVDETWRGKGIGKQLVRQAIQWSKAEGAPTLRVRSNVMRKAAHQFYLNQGFAEKKQQKVFEMLL